VETRGPDGAHGRDPAWAQSLHTLYFDSDSHLRRRRRRFAAVLLVGTVVAVGTVYFEASHSASPQSQRTASGSAAGRRGRGAPAVAPTNAVRAPSIEPGGGRTLLPDRRIVAFYGAAGIAKLGVLGEAPPEDLWPRLAAQAAAYEQPDAPVLPAFELIAFTAQAAPGPTRTYSVRVADETIDHYLGVVRAHHGLLILDIQPGRGDFLADAESLQPWLGQPDVGLALDPEWKLDANQVPGRQIGHTTAAVVNSVSAWLGQLVASQNLPQKLMLIHQFTPDMVRDKRSVATVPGLALVFNMDGYGGPEAKLSKYELLSADSRFLLGFKVFYHQDTSPFSPSDLLSLSPAPSVVEYE
jgi:hypothetical protein